MKKEPRYDVIGIWSETKLDIIRRYASEYTKILSAQNNPQFTYIYIDAFAGPGLHISKTTGEFVPGSPLNALNIPIPFLEYHFIDMDNRKVAVLEDLAGERENVFIYQGDCNDKMLEVLPKVDYSKYRRALCILDPYGLHLKWNIIEMAGKMKSVEIFLNFPIMDMNMNVLKHNADKVDPSQITRMNAFWGDESWKEAAYKPSRQQNLFGDMDEEKTTNEDIEKAFRNRLKAVAGFKYVPEPMAMRNKTGAVLYYLYFASHRPVAADIVKYIFDKHRNGVFS